MAVPQPNRGAFERMNNATFNDINKVADKSYVQTVANGDPDLYYQSGSDAVIEINNIVIDELYDLQYSYREIKEPIYGYRSKTFDAVLNGTILIQGQFTLNYVADAYLSAILNYGGSFGIANEVIVKVTDYDASASYAQSLYNFKYARDNAENATKELAKLEIEKAVIEAKIKQNAVSSDDAVKSMKKQRDIILDESKKSISESRMIEAKNKNKIFNLIMEQYSKNLDIINKNDDDPIVTKMSVILNTEDCPAYLKEYWPSDPSIINYNTKNKKENRELTNEELKKAALSVLEPKLLTWPPYNEDAKNLAETNSGIAIGNALSGISESAYVKSTETLQANLASIVEAIGKKREVIAALATLKSKSNEDYAKIKAEPVNSLSVIKKKSLTSTDSYSNNGVDMKQLLRYNKNWNYFSIAEDYNKSLGKSNKGFNITVSYHGVPHITLEECHITGHTDVIGLGGECIKRFYTFFAKSKKVEFNTN